MVKSCSSQRPVLRVPLPAAFMLIACSEPRVPQDSGVNSTSKQRLKLARSTLTALILFGLIFVSHVSLSSTNVVRTDYVVDSTSFISEYRYKN